MSQTTGARSWEEGVHKEEEIAETMNLGRAGFEY